MSRTLVIAIDGPAGAGKSTVARRVASRLGCPYVDTGAMYRALTLKAYRSDAGFDDDALSELARETHIGFEPLPDGSQRVLLDGDDVTSDIRSPEVTGRVSQVSAVPGVRHEMVRQQRELVTRSGAVMDGRDIGTVVLPNADHKFYVDAAPELRARRRWLELQERGVSASFEQVLADQLERDAKDSEREVSPLCPADDAVVIDTSGLSIDDVVAVILRECGERDGIAIGELGVDMR